MESNISRLQEKIDAAHAEERESAVAEANARQEYEDLREIVLVNKPVWQQAVRANEGKIQGIETEIQGLVEEALLIEAEVATLESSNESKKQTALSEASSAESAVEAQRLKLDRVKEVVVGTFCILLLYLLLSVNSNTF